MSKILVVDDLLSDRRIAGGLLTNNDGHSVEYAINGLDALEQIELHLPDLVLTDLQMPEMIGSADSRSLSPDSHNSHDGPGK